MILITIFRAALFYIIPILIGYGLLSIFQKLNKRPSLITTLRTQLEHTLIGRETALATNLLQTGVVSLVLGVVTLLSLALGFNSLATFTENQTIFRNGYFLSAYLLFFAGSGITISDWLKNYYSFPLPSWQKIISGVLILLGVIGIWNWKTPYSLNWDLYEHQTLSRIIQKGEFNFQTTKLSDTFGFSSYPPTYHLLLATSQSLQEEKPATILLYWQWLGYFHLLTVALASYFVGLATTKNKTVAIISTVIGITIFESVIAFTSLFSLPQTVTATIFALAWATTVLTADNRVNRLTAIQLSLISVCLVLMHYIIGTVSTALLISTYLVLNNSKLRRFIKKSKILLSYTAVTIILAGITYFINFSEINSGEAASYLFGLGEKFRYGLSIYGLSFVLFGLLGAWVLFKKNIERKYLLSYILIGFTALLFSNIPYVLKFYTIARYFIHALMAVALWWIIQKVVKIKSVALIVIGIVFLIIFTINAISWKQHLLFQNRYSHVSPDDLATAEYLQDNYVRDSSVMIVSDPATMYLLEGLSGVNSPGGVFSNQETRMYIYEALSQGSSNDIADQLAMIDDPIEQKPRTYLLVISGRTFSWFNASESLRSAFDYNVWHPEAHSLSDQIEIDAFLETGATVLYKNSSYVIVRI